MSEKEQGKKLGRGIEDFSHLFLAPEQNEIEEPVEKFSQIEESPKSSKIVCFTSHGNNKERVFFLLNLALELAASGKKILIIDADFTSPRICMLVNSPVYGSILNLLSQNGNTGDLDEISSGVRLITLDLDISDLSALGIKKRLQLKRYFKKAELESDFVFVNFSPNFNLSLVRDIINSGDDFVFLTPTPVNGMINTYSIIKKVFFINKTASLGIVTLNAGRPGQSDNVFAKMQGVVGKFLEKSLINYGTLPDDPEIFRSITRQEPLSLNLENSKTIESIRNISQLMLNPSSAGSSNNSNPHSISGFTECVFGERLEKSY